jgi:hypothetical protein
MISLRRLYDRLAFMCAKWRGRLFGEGIKEVLRWTGLQDSQDGTGFKEMIFGRD